MNTLWMLLSLYGLDADASDRGWQPLGRYDYVESSECDTVATYMNVRRPSASFPCSELVPPAPSGQR